MSSDVIIRPLPPFLYIVNWSLYCLPTDSRIYVLRELTSRGDNSLSPRYASIIWIKYSDDIPSRTLCHGAPSAGVAITHWREPVCSISRALSIEGNSGGSSKLARSRLTMPKPRICVVLCVGSISTFSVRLLSVGNSSYSVIWSIVSQCMAIGNIGKLPLAQCGDWLVGMNGWWLAC